MRVFYDTSPFIYLIENHYKYKKIISSYIINNFTNSDDLVTSVITLSEFGVKPAKLKENYIIHGFRRFLNNLSFEILPVYEREAELSYYLRSKYDFLKAMDALQLSLSIVNQCNEFITNDKKLAKIEEIEIIYIDELLNIKK